MSNQKKSKKKKAVDEKQKSLTSFITTSKPSPEKAKGAPKKIQKDKEEPTENVAKLDEKKENIKKPEKKIEKQPDKAQPEINTNKEIPKELFFEGNDAPFGLKEGNVALTSISRESVSSKYLRYLIKKGEIVQDLEKGLLLDVDYDGGQNKAYCKFYDLESEEIKIWIDTTNHEPYCISKAPKSELESNVKLTNYEGFDRFEDVKIVDLLRDREIEATKIYGKTPTNIGGSGENVKNILDGEAWEADIRYHHNYIYDRALVPGLVYRIKNGKVEKLSIEDNLKDSENVSKELLDLFKEEKPEMQDFAKRNLDVFLTPIINAKRMAIDIEVSIGEHDYRIPDPRLAKQEIIAVSFVATDGKNLVYVLEREGFKYGDPHEKFPDDAEVVYFKSEKLLLTETFRLIWEYPIILTFNGDNFDLNYMFHRANRLKIDRDLNPIHVKRGFGRMVAECNLRKGIHIDLFNFFSNRSISGYAFGGAYGRNSLNAISKALLKKKKYKHEEEIHEMEYNVLTWYNLKDSILTLDLTTFNDNLVWNLIILLCRMTKLPIHDMLRHQISAWIRNIFFYEHRQMNYLIPRRSEIRDLKKGGGSTAIIDGKGFQGAYVIPPIPGIHYDVVVMDFSSLYPSIIKEYNLSYETVQCPHDDCTDNLIKGTPHHVCSHKMGIFAYVVGFFRDIRVKYFKPKSGDKKIPEEQRSYYNTIQQALKVFINGSYGVFGSENFPLFCLPVAESTTGIGRYSIKATIDKSEEMNITVLYGDTDSVFLLNPSKTQLKEISKWSRDELDLDLEEEKMYQFLALSERKKNYIGIYKETKNVDMKGLVAKKKNTPNFIKKVFGQLIDILKEITDDEEFNKARNEIIEMVRNNQKKIGKPDTFTLEDYAINISLQKNINSYDKVIPQHVRAAKDFIDFEINRELKSAKSESDAKRIRKAILEKYQKGNVVTFIKSKGKTGAKVMEIAKLQDIDPKKYQELLRSALEQVLDALGITFEEIRGIKKMDAFF